MSFLIVFTCRIELSFLGGLSLNFCTEICKYYFQKAVGEWVLEVESDVLPSNRRIKYSE